MPTGPANPQQPPGDPGDPSPFPPKQPVPAVEASDIPRPQDIDTIAVLTIATEILAQRLTVANKIDYDLWPQLQNAAHQQAEEKYADRQKVGIPS